MAEISRRGLDPAAEEFRPGNPTPLTPPHLYYCPVLIQDLPLSSSPTRSLLLTALPSHATESVLRADLEAFGDVRGLRMDAIRYGILTVHFYDLRHAQRAFTQIRNQYRIGGCGVWAEFVVSCEGALVVCNSGGLDLPTSTLNQIFQRFGGVKEMREAPLKKHGRWFIEFFDVRDAEKAVREMNGKEILGKVVTLHFSTPGGVGRKPLSSNLPIMALAATRHHHHHHHKRQYLSSREDKFEAVNCSGDSNKFIIPTRQSPPSSKQQPRRMMNTATGGFRMRNNFLRKPDPCFLITENTASHCIDSRTTVMIKNIPNKYSLNLLLKTLDEHCMKCNQEGTGKDLVPLSSYDFVYLPIDFNNKCNVGYGFVNWTSPEGACRLFKAFNLQAWEVFNSRKICQVSYARLQGLEAVKEHFRKSKFPREMKEHELPVVFCPPRDGIQRTEPLPVVGDGTGAHPSESAAADKC